MRRVSGAIVDAAVRTRLKARGQVALGDVDGRHQGDVRRDALTGFVAERAAHPVDLRRKRLGDEEHDSEALAGHQRLPVSVGVVVDLVDRLVAHHPLPSDEGAAERHHGHAAEHAQPMRYLSRTGTSYGILSAKNGRQCLVEVGASNTGWWGVRIPCAYD